MYEGKSVPKSEKYISGRFDYFGSIIMQSKKKCFWYCPFLILKIYENAQSHNHPIHSVKLAVETIIVKWLNCQLHFNEFQC